MVKMDEISLPSSMRSNLAQYKQLTFFRDKTGSRSRGSSSSRLPSHRFNLDRIASRFKNPAPQSHDISILYTNTYCICLYMHKDILRDVIYTCLFTGNEYIQTHTCTCYWFCSSEDSNRYKYCQSF